MTPYEITERIFAEREKQDIKHPNLPKYFLHPITDPCKEHLKMATVYMKQDNDLAEEKLEHSWYSIMREELYESFCETEQEKINDEVIQLAALCYRYLESH